jgi:putative intracellular protease/amidase
MTSQHPQIIDYEKQHPGQGSLNNHKALVMTARLPGDKKRGKIAALVSSPINHPLTGKRVGFHLGELCHAKFIFCEAGYEVDIYSTEGGPVEWDEESDPDKNQHASHDLLSAGFLSRPLFREKLQKTKKLVDLDPTDYVAIWLVGGMGPSTTFRHNPVLEKALAKFADTGKGIGGVCHGPSVLLDARNSKGDLIVRGKKWTAITDEEEKVLEKLTGTKNQIYWIESEARKIADTTFMAGEAFQQHAIRDDNLVTGQQNHSAILAAQLLIEAIHSAQVQFLGVN